MARLMENGFYSLDAPPERIGVPDTHIPFSPSLEQEVLPSAEDVTAAIRRLT